MSPTEFDLRAALHDGDDDANLNVDRLILDARARAAQRRGRLMSGAAIAVVVATAGVGGTLLVRNGNTADSSKAAGGAAAASHGANLDKNAGSAALAPGSGARAAMSEAIDCPTSLPHYLLPGGGSPGQFGADQPLFSKSVSAVVVCAYGTAEKSSLSATSHHPARLELRGDDAKRLAASLENAPLTQAAAEPVACEPGTTGTYPLAIIGVAANGTKVATVTVSMSSCVQVTNGTAIRYGWQPPSDLRKVLLELKPTS
jgi:hypothetical protein